MESWRPTTFPCICFKIAYFNQPMHFSKRRTKLVATLGPATDIPKVLEELLKTGVNVVRLNMSHGSFEEHGRRVRWVRRLAKRLNLPVAVLMDLQGPKIRTGRFKSGRSVHLVKNQLLEITTKSILGDSQCVSTSYQRLVQDVKKGDPILLDDGKLRLVVESKTKSSVICRVALGGWLKEKAGMNLPESSVSSPALTKKDFEDLKFGLKMDVDCVALSFVRRAEDVLGLKRWLKAQRFFIPVIAKIERAEALERLDEILIASEGVMVARGDLGVEVSLERVPVLQKNIIRKANEAGAMVITATQMLESMVAHPRPTRAEASDVANAIFDGTDCVMLSGETAAGKYPIEAVRVMSAIAEEAERNFSVPTFDTMLYHRYHHEDPMVHAVVHAACHAAKEVDAKAIMVFTLTGKTCRMISKLKPKQPIIGITPTEGPYRQMAMGWGITPITSPLGHSTDEMFHLGEKTVLKKKLLNKGDRVVVISGTQFIRGATNMMKILTLR